MKTFQLTQQQQDQIATSIDAAVRAGGIQSALWAVPLFLDLQRQADAQPDNAPSPAPDVAANAAPATA